MSPKYNRKYLTLSIICILSLSFIFYIFDLPSTVHKKTNDREKVQVQHKKKFARKLQDGDMRRRYARRTLYEKNIEPSYYKYKLKTSSRDGDLALARLLIEAGTDVNATDGGDDTPLIYASREGHIEIVRLLLASPDIDVNKTSNSGFTPLICASINGHSHVVKLLLKAGAHVDAEGSYGGTALNWAAASGYVEVVKLLLNANANVNSVDKLGTTPLIFAAMNDQVEVVHILLDANASLNYVNNFGHTALSAAESNRNYEIIEILRNAENKNFRGSNEK